jgi:hypothetical protein
MDELGVSNRLEVNLADLKSILIHNKENKEGYFYCLVPPSRFRKILSDYWALKSIEIEGALDNYAQNYRSFVLYNLDKQSDKELGNQNSYLIVKDKSLEETKGKCSECDCNKKRWINPKTGVCYYKEAIKENYLTKIPK